MDNGNIPPIILDIDKNIDFEMAGCDDFEACLTE